MTNNSTNQTVSQTDCYECECLEDKKFRIVFDGDSTGNYIVEYCQKCYEQDDKQFMLLTEELF